MKFYTDTLAERPRIEAAIKKWGYAAEHNFWWYQYYQYYYNPPQKNIFVETEDGALFTAHDERHDEHFVVFDPLAPKGVRVPLLMEYITWIFSNTASQKIWFQLERDTRPGFLKALSGITAPCRSNRIYYTMEWPIYDLRQFDPELPGGHYKTLRKEMHKFYREHHVAVADAKTYEDRESLHTIIDTWKKKRPNHERSMIGVYHQIIDDNFEGTLEARVFVVDGRPAGINAGWMIPNSDRFYGAVGIHDYSVDDLGAMLYLEDMIWLKKKGYHETDMGGSEKPLMAFKNKFQPQSSYKMDVFSVVKNKLS